MTMTSFLGAESSHGTKSEKLLDFSRSQKSKRTVVVIFLVVSIEHEDVVADGNSIELISNAEVRAQSTLHRRLTTGDRKTEGDRDVVDDALERVIVFDGGGKGWTVTGQRLVERLTVGNVDVLDVERVEEGTDVLGGVVRNAAGKSVRQDPDPDSRVGVVAISVFDGLDAWDVVVVQVFLFLFLGIVVLVVLDLPARVLVQPSESNKIDRCDFDLLLVE